MKRQPAQEQETTKENLGATIVFEAVGTPRPQPRPRFARGRVVSTLDPRAKAWKASVCRAARAVITNLGGKPVLHEMLGGIDDPLRLDSVFHMPTKDSARWGHLHCMKPDKDNLEKLAMDAMADAGLFSGGTSGGVREGDDCRVCCGGPRKIWCRPSEAGASFRLSRVIEDGSSPIVRGNGAQKRIRRAKRATVESVSDSVLAWIAG